MKKIFLIFIGIFLSVETLSAGESNSEEDQNCFLLYVGPQWLPIEKMPTRWLPEKRSGELGMEFRAFLQMWKPSDDSLSAAVTLSPTSGEFSPGYFDMDFVYTQLERAKYKQHQHWLFPQLLQLFDSNNETFRKVRAELPVSFVERIGKINQSSGKDGPLETRECVFEFFDSKSDFENYPLKEMRPSEEMRNPKKKGLWKSIGVSTAVVGVGLGSALGSYYMWNSFIKEGVLSYLRTHNGYLHEKAETIERILCVGVTASCSLSLAWLTYSLLG